MSHDIIDNQDQKLVDHINQILGSTNAVKFAVGYFFLSGLEAVAEHLMNVGSLQLLIGNTTNRETVEQIAEGYKRLELVAAFEERERYLKRNEQMERAEETAINLRQTIEQMDQTDDAQALVSTLIQMIQEKRLKVKVYTKGRLHSKAYIFDYREDGRYEKGVAIVGSSNLSLAGLTHNSELNVVVHGDDNHLQLTRWFEKLWDDAEDFEAHLMEELSSSWAGHPATPYDVYMKALYTLVADRLEGDDDGEILWDDELTRSLADFQKVAVHQAIQIIQEYGGVFVSDVVGLGKSYIGAAVVKHFERIHHARPLIICPVPLQEMWENYNEKFQLNARVLTTSMLRTGAEKEGNILDGPLYKDRDFVLVDESHNFRHHTSQRYEVLQEYLTKGNRKSCLLTATPRNKSARDVYNQIRLFHPDDITELPIDPPNLKSYFKEVDKGSKRLQDLLIHILIRRTRRHILRYYGFAEESKQPLRELSDETVTPYLDGRRRAYVMVGGKHQFFPRRGLDTLRYSIEETYIGLYDQIRSLLGRGNGEKYHPSPGKELTYARYGLWHYVREEKRSLKKYQELQRAGINLRGLIRVMLFKRFESSVYAFRESLHRLERVHAMFLKAMDNGLVPAGEEAQSLLYESDRYEEAELMDALERCSGSYFLEDFDDKRLRENIAADRELIKEILSLVEPITPDKDAKLQTMIAGLGRNGSGKQGKVPVIPQATGKVLIFTQYADTAKYLYENLNPNENDKDIECIYGTGKSKARMAARFAPKANPDFDFRPDPPISILVATDVMSEGLNLQDGDVVVNYDLHWNPVRLIQRFGRIDRIGSENDAIWGFNFLPETELEKNLGLTDLLHKRIQEIHDTIGEDAEILDKTEQLNEEAMFAIYEKNCEQLTLFEDESSDLIDMNEAEELIRTLRADDPEEFHRIAQLRDGIRSAKSVFSNQGKIVFCRAGRYHKMFLLDNQDKVLSRDIPAILGKMRCAWEESTCRVPGGHNQTVSEVMNIFKREVRQRQSHQKYSLSLTDGQKYALRELRLFYGQLTDEENEFRKQVSLLEEAFKQPLSMAIRKPLNMLRRNGIVGRNLISLLTDLYHEHGLNDRKNHRDEKHIKQSDDYPRIVCSEALL